MASRYDIGDAVVMEVVFTDPADGNQVDPSGEVSCTVRDPAGTETKYVFGVDPELTKLEVGKYQCKVVVDAAGTWCYRWAALDQSQEESNFEVNIGCVTPAS